MTTFRTEAIAGERASVGGLHVVLVALAIGCSGPKPADQAPVGAKSTDATAAAADAPAAKQPAARTSACLADELGALRVDPPTQYECTPTDMACRVACERGDAAACVRRAATLGLRHPGTDEEAGALFRRACTLGHATGCLNYAAGIWAHSTDPAARECARRLFERTCQVGEFFGCGMFGTMLVDDGGPDDVARGKKLLETSCDKRDGYACRALALELEAGKLGAYEPARVQALLARACQAGDALACGDPATAKETLDPHRVPNP